MPMIRTIVTMEESDKEWLDHYSHLHQQSLAETIRQAIHSYQAQASTGGRDQMLKETAGIWKGRNRDGLDHQRELRREWD